MSCLQVPHRTLSSAGRPSLVETEGCVLVERAVEESQKPGWQGLVPFIYFILARGGEKRIVGGWGKEVRVGACLLTLTFHTVSHLSLTTVSQG